MYQVLRIDRRWPMADDRLRDVAIATHFGAESAELATPSFILQAFQNGLEDHNAKMRVNSHHTRLHLIEIW